MDRLKVIDQLASRSGGFVLSVGAQSTRLADVNVDKHARCQASKTGFTTFMVCSREGGPAL